MQSRISAAKNKLRRPETYAETVGSAFEADVADVYETTSASCTRLNAMDFDDLLVNAVELLEKYQQVRDRYASQFRWVMVDEYQDTNHVQYRWLQLLTSEHRNLAVVGDDAQSIYGFRGADIRNILDSSDDYPDAHVVKLEQNYRSTQTILDAANAVIANNRGQMPKHLWTDAGGGRPGARAGDGRRARRGTLGPAEIQRLVDEGCPALRSRSSTGPTRSRGCWKRCCPRAGAYQVIGGTKFYERAEIKDAMQYLTFLVNPKDGRPSRAS